MNGAARIVLCLLGISAVWNETTCFKENKNIFDGTEFGCARVKEVDFFQTPCGTAIATLKDKKSGKRFIVKQKQGKTLGWHMGVAREKLGYHVAESINIPINRVEIIPTDRAFPGKHEVGLPATLHEVVPGVKVTFLPKPLKVLKVFIQQPIKPTVSRTQWGLTRRVIQDMALHPDLPPLVAFDTFIGNADRHRGNLFYDKKTNHFFAIDLESSFNKDLASYAGDLIVSMIESKYENILPQELQALETYRDVLKKLIKLHTPDSLCKKFVEYSIEGGILSRISKSSFMAIAKSCEEKIEKNYDSCVRLVYLLDKFIKKQYRLSKKAVSRGYLG